MSGVAEVEDATSQGKLVDRVRRVIAVQILVKGYQTEIDRTVKLISQGTLPKALVFYHQHSADLRKYKAILIAEQKKLLDGGDSRFVSLCRLLMAYNRDVARTKELLKLGKLPSVLELCRLHLAKAERVRMIFLDYLKRH